MIITWENANGNTISFDEDDKSEYRIINFEGAGSMPASIQTQKAPYQDGETLIDQLLEPRNMTIELMIMGDYNEQYSKRRELQNLFNPKLGTGTLTWDRNNGSEFEIEVVPDGSPTFPGKGGRSVGHQSVIIDFTAPNPFWKDTFTSGDVMSFFIPQFSFDLQLSDEYELETNGTNRLTLNNDGDVETPVFIEFNGPASNPKVTNETTGEYIEVTQELLEGERLLINTAFGKKSVVFDDGNEQVNAFGQINLNSTFWNMKVGENQIVYTADAGIDTASVRVSYKERFIGV